MSKPAARIWAKSLREFHAALMLYLPAPASTLAYLVHLPTNRTSSHLSSSLVLYRPQPSHALLWRLHHVQELRVEGQAEMGNPPLKMRLVAEGLVLQDALTRSRLFPETRLAELLTADAETVVVDDVTGFPEGGGFRIRIGEEWMTVQKTSGPQWTVRRGAFGSTAVAHAKDGPVDLDFDEGIL